jgi:beta-lactamase regulating signal transducer with metallopeptidase domain/protocatechuate 3,4-dioxygenase beta subunit
MNTFDVSRALWDYYLWATVLLTTALLALLLIRQPARRMALAWATAGGLLVLFVLTAVPNWSRYSLASPAPAVVPVVERSEPLVIAAPQVEIAAPRDTQSQPLVEPTPIQVSLPFDWQGLVLPLLATGSLAVIGWLALGSWQARRLRGKALTPPSAVAELFAQLTRGRQPRIELGVHRELPVAVALGLRRPCILLPQTLVDQASAEQLRSVLAHELAHVEHRDLWLLALLRALAVVLWPHPLFWLLKRQVRHDQEVLADTAAAELTSRVDYAEQLVALARSAVAVRVPRLASSVGLWEKRTQLTERIKLLLDEKLTILRNCSRGWRIGSAGMLAALALGLSLVTLSPAEVAETAEVETAEASPTALSVQEISPAKPTANRQEPNVVQGICFDENSKPLAGVVIDVFTSTNRSGEPRKIASTKSNAKGRFELTSVIDIEQEFPDGLPDENVMPPGLPIVGVVAHTPGRATGFTNDMAFRVAQQGKLDIFFRMGTARTLQGRVLDEQNRPVRGARVSTSSWSDGVGIPTNINAAVTDAEGRFEIADLAAYDAEQARKEFEASQNDFLTVAGSGMPWDRFITVEHPKFARKRAKITSIPGSVDVTLSPGAVLTGQVVAQEAGAEPQPATNVEVMAMLLPTAESPSPFGYQVLNTKTDEAGNYRFESLPAGVYAVHAYLPDWVTNGIEDVNVARGETVAAPPITMTRGGRVRIQLINDGTGKPLVFDKPTKAYVNPQPRPQKSNSFGRPNIVEFSTTGVGEMQVPAGKFAFLISIPTKESSIPARESSLGWVTAEFARIRSQEDYDKLTAYQTDEGKVVEIEVRMAKEGEAPRLQLFDASSTEEDQEPAEEKPTGTLIPATAPAEVETSQPVSKPQASNPHYGDDNWRVMVALDQQLDKHRQANQIHGLCVDEAGNPLPGAQVTVYALRFDGSTHETAQIAATVSNAEGEFRFKNVIDIEQEFPDGLSEPTQPAGNFITVVSRLAGRVPGYAQGGPAAEVARSGKAEVLKMPPAQMLKGRIVDSKQQPVSGAQLRIVQNGFLPGLPQDIHSATTDANGQFVIDDHAAYDAAQAARGPHNPYAGELGFNTWQKFVEITHPDFARKRISDFKIPGSIEVTLSSGATITGRVLTQEANNAPVVAAGSVVGLQRYLSPAEIERGETQYMTTKADQQGEFRFDSLPSGTYSLNATHAGWVSNGIEEIEVTAGQAASAPDIVMTRGGIVRVQLVDEQTGKSATLQEPTKGFILSSLRPINAGRITDGGSGQVEFSTSGTAERYLPPGEYTIVANIMGSDGRSYWQLRDVAAIRADLRVDTIYEVVEGEVLTIEMQKVGEAQQVSHTPGFLRAVEPIAETATPKIIFPTPVPANKPSATLVPTLPFKTETSENSNKHTTIPPKLLYLAWQEESSQPGWGKMVLWDTVGKTPGAAEAQEFLARAGHKIFANHDDSLTPLVLFLEVDKSINAQVMPTLITKEGARISTGSARTQQVDGVNVAVVVASRTNLAAWPEKVSLELSYATENWQVIKTVTEVGAQPIEIADGVRWYLDPAKAQERDPNTGRLRWAKGKTAGVLETSEVVRKGLMDYDVRVFLKGEAMPLPGMYTTIVTRDDGNHMIRVSDAFDSADQIERVEFIRQQRAIETVDNVPLRLDLLLEESKRLPNEKGAAYENGVLGNGEVYR